MKKVEALEIMDTVSLPLDQMRQTLRFLALTNKYFGGAEVILAHLSRFSQKWNHTEEIKILDIGTGGAEIPIEIIHWSRKNNFPVKIVGLDLTPEVAHIAREHTEKYPEIEIREQNVFDLDDHEKFDYTTASLLLHHIPPQEQIRFLQKIDALTIRGIILSDLRRSWPSLLSITSLSWLIGNAVVKNDGPLSVRRAFTMAELNQLAREAHLNYLHAAVNPWFRLSLAGEK